MTEKSAPAPPTVRNKVSTGYARLDEALQGGFLSGSAIVLCAPASDEVPLLLRNFLESTGEPSLLICRTPSSAESLARAETVKALVSSDKPPSPARNIIPGKGVENLTELNLAINDTFSSLQPKRLVIDILGDVLLRHKALQTRKWLTEILERFRSKEIVTLAVLNPYMHAAEDTQAVTELFDGNLEIIEKQTEEGLRKVLRVKWMHGIEVAEKEFPLTELASQPSIRPEQIVTKPSPLKEPRWLTPLVSRSVELEKLRNAFEDALQGKSSVVALQGEAGIGKSRLMQELAAYANAKGAVVLSGRSTQDATPYAPWIEIARQYVAQAPGEILRRLLGANASELVKLVPDLAVKLGTIPPSKTTSQDKTQFYEAVTQFFVAISGTVPLLLLFEDAQNLDQPSAELWEYLVRSTSSLHILSVCSTPLEQEIDPNSQLDRLLLTFNKERLLETISLPSLNRDETATLIKETFGEETVSPEFADLIYQRSGGNPFFVEEILRSLVADGTIFRTEKRWDRKPIQDIAMPKTVKTALKARLAKLDSESMSMLEWAATIGSEFDFDVLRDSAQIAEDALLEKLESVIKQGLILEEPNEPGKLRFADERLKELLLEDLVQLKRRRYHQKIAEAMEKAYASNLENQAETIAPHFAQAGDKERTIKYSIVAGDRDRSVHAYQEAVGNYKRALALVDDRDAEKAVVLEKLADGCFYAGQAQESIQHFEQALRIFQKLNDTTACARVYLGLAKATRQVKGMGPGAVEAAQVLKRGLEYLGQDLESFETAEIYAKLSDYYGLVDEFDEANVWAEKALHAGEKTNNFGAVAEALWARASFLTDTGRLDEGLPLWERAFNFSLEHELYEEAINCAHNLSAYTYPRNLGKAKQLELKALELSKRINHITREAVGLMWLSYLTWLHGEWDDAFAELEKAFEIKRRLNLTTIVGTWDRGWKALLFLSKGELQQAEVEVQQALASHEPKITFIVANNLVMGLVRLEQGRVEEARTCFERGVEAFKNWEFTTVPLWHIETLLQLSSICVKRGELDEARRLCEWARRLAETLKSDAGLAMALQAEATLFMASEDRMRAEDTYLKCLALWEKAAWPYYHANALVAYSEALARTNPEESKKRLEQAAEIFRKLGAKRDLEKAESKLQS